eukprot:Phypoly_transcript_03117.p1 GENE.Phypoly_transcript_03117~~Phypoly_transcript_03117.p1  ORF type:complete len:804 (+),score=114.88 Phypoly_transcript_03117:150-2561(+)
MASPPPSPHPLTPDHIKLLYMISVYTGPKSKGVNKEEKRKEGATGRWIRKIPLQVLIYEGVIQGVFDYDYAPCSEVVGTRRMFLNISQEGKDDIDDLREADLISGLKLSTSEYQSITAYQINKDGLKELEKHLTKDYQEAVDSFIYRDNQLFEVYSEGDSFVLKTSSGYSYTSSITESEDVSYVTSPYLPKNLRQGGRPTSVNSHRIDECLKGEHNIKDELDEVIVLSEVSLLIGEWIPFGSNQIIALIQKLGASERVKGGLFTALVDEEPDGMTFTVPDDLAKGMTSVSILDFAFSKHLNFEAEVYFEEEDGIVQVEHFGVHLSHDGTTVLGLKIEALLDRDKTHISLDHLARVLADIHQDSSQILESLMTSYQRSLLSMMFSGDSLNRDKFSCIVAKSITPRLHAEKYMDKEAYENELTQVVGAIQSAYDLESGQLLILGTHGLLLVGDFNDISEKDVTSYLSLMGREVFLSNYFHRTFTLHETLKNTRVMINDYEKNPNSIQRIRTALSQASKDAVLLQEILSYIEESMHSEKDFINLESPLASILKVPELFQIITRRIADLQKNIQGIHHELNGLREMTDVISEATMFRVQESLQANTKSLANVFEASERSSSSLEVLQVVLSGTLAFEILDRLTGEWSVMETSWGKAYIHDPLIETPGVWFVINLLLWAFIGWLLKVIMGHLTEKSSGVLTVRFRPNVPIVLSALHNYLEDKDLGEQEVGIESKQQIKKVSWTDDDNIVKGKELKIDLCWDDDHGFWLSCAIQLNRGKGLGGLDADQIRQLMFKEFAKYGILPEKVQE